MPTIYKNVGTGIRNNRTRPKGTKLYRRTDIVTGTLGGIDNFSLKNVVKKIGGVVGDIGKSVANVAIAPVKAAADLVSKDDRIKDWGFQSGAFANEGIGKVSETTMNIGTTLGKIAEPLLAGGAIASTIANKVSSNKDLRADQESASIPIPNVEPPKVAEVAQAVTPQTAVNIPNDGVGATVKNLASKITPANIDKATNLVKSGKGLLTKDQEVLSRNLTSPALLPKTKASKEAERALTLPYVSKDSAVLGSMPTPDPKTLMLIGGVLAAIVVLALLLKK